MISNDSSVVSNLQSSIDYLEEQISLFKNGDQDPALAFTVFEKFLDVRAQFEFLSGDITDAFEERSTSIVSSVHPLLAAKHIASIEDGIISFVDTPAHMLANAFLCGKPFEFSGKVYASADVCFREHNNDHDLNYDVMMHVLRAKFGQNPDLKAALLATGDSYIYCQNSWENFLGRCLIQLRGEYEGTGIVEPPVHFQRADQYLKLKCDVLGNNIPYDLVRKFVGYLDLASVKSVINVNKIWGREAFAYLQEVISGVTTIGRDCYREFEDLGLQIEEEIPIDVTVVKEFATKFGPLMEFGAEEENLGFTCLHIPKGLSIKILTQIAEKARMRIDISEGVSSQIKEASESYNVILSNSFIIKRSWEAVYIKEELSRVGSEEASALEVMTLCVMTFVIYKKCFLVSSDSSSSRPLCYTSTASVINRITVGAFFAGEGNIKPSLLVDVASADGSVARKKL